MGQFRDTIIDKRISVQIAQRKKKEKKEKKKNVNDIFGWKIEKWVDL